MRVVHPPAASIRNGDLRALAQAATFLENHPFQAHGLIGELFRFSGTARIIGVTGPAGAGKSTLISACVRHLRERGRTVAVLAMDPSSQSTQGAILGDRIRMDEHSSDAGVFIRSAATRGNPGGIAAATLDLALLFDAAGFQDVLVETIGAGQDEIDIANIAHLTIVVFMPGAGDDVQAEKAGIMEIADIFAINKGDLPGAARLSEQIGSVQSIGSGGQQVPIVQVSALRGDGIDDLLNVMDSLFIQNSRPAAAQQRWRRILTGLVAKQAVVRVDPSRLEREATSLSLGENDPYTAADRLLTATRGREMHYER